VIANPLSGRPLFSEADFRPISYSDRPSRHNVSGYLSGRAGFHYHSWAGWASWPV